MRLHNSQFNFSGGIVDADFSPSSDSAIYVNGLSSANNMILTPLGSLFRRPGFSYLSSTYSSSLASRLIPFTSSDSATYLLEFCNSGIQIFNNGTSTTSTAAISNGTFTSNITGWTNASVGTGTVAYNAASGGVMRMVSGATVNYAIAYQAVSNLGIAQHTLTFDVATTSVTLKIGSTLAGTDLYNGTITTGVGKTANFTPTTAGTVYIQFEVQTASSTADIDNVVLSTPTLVLNNPYSAAQLLELTYSQYQDTLYLYHKDVATRKLVRTSDSVWALSSVSFVDGPWNDANTSTTTLSFGNILNGTFTTDITDWTNNSVGTGAISWNTARLRLVSGASTNYAKAYQALSGVPAGTYTLMFDTVTAQSSVSVSTTIGGAEISTLTSTAVATDNRVQFTVTAAQAGTIYINFEQRTASTTSDIDNVRILDMGVSSGTSVQVVASAATFTSNDVGRFIRIQATNSIVDKIVYAANSSKKAFDISDLQLSPDGIDVYLYVTTTGVQTYQRPGTDYTISNNQVVMTTVPSSGTNVLINPKAWGDGKWSYALITAYTSSTRVTATLQNFCSGRNVSTRWRLGAFYAGNYPNVGTFHEGRMYVANNSNVVYGSVSGSFESFKPDNAATRGVPDPSASVQFRLATKQNFRVLWLLSQKVLYVGTTQDVTTIQASQGGYISARSLPIPLRSSETACSAVQPIQIDDDIIFADYTGQRLYTVVYGQGGPQSQIISGHCADLFRTKTIKEFAFQKYPQKILWIKRSDGSLVSAVKSLKYGNWGFTEHTLGGVSPSVEGLATVPTSTGATDLYVSVARTIGGGTVRYLERMATFPKDLSLGAIVTQDSAITYSGASTPTITGLTHLNGETVYVNNGSHGSTETKVPSGGSISLTNDTTSATIGLYSNASFQTLPLIIQLGNGSAIHKVKNVYKGDAELYQTIGMQIGATSASDLGTVPFDSSTVTFSGHKGLEVASNFGTDVTLYFKQPNPLPLTVKNITISTNIEDERKYNN